MANNRVYPASEPTLSDLLAWHKRDVKHSINCVMVGKINEFQASKNTATIKIMSKMSFIDGEVLEYPLLTDCPVFTLQGGGSYLNMPVSAGDYCIVLFNDRSLDDWWVSGDAKAPNIIHTHSLSDGIALVGIQPLTALLPLSGSVVGLYGVDKPVEVSGTGVSIDSGADLVTIKNAVTSLYAILKYLMDQLGSQAQCTGNGVAINPAWSNVNGFMKLALEQLDTLLGE